MIQLWNGVSIVTLSVDISISGMDDCYIGLECK